MRGMRPSGAGRAAAAEEPSEHEVRSSLGSRTRAAEVLARAELARGWLAVDPITAAFGETVPLHGILFLRADVADECDDASAHEAAAQPLPARAGGLVAPPTALAALMAGRMAKQHALRLDYLELHLARHYRAALRRAHLLCHRRPSRAAPAAPVVRRELSGGMKRSRVPTAEHLPSLQRPALRRAPSRKNADRGSAPAAAAEADGDEDDEESWLGYGRPVGGGQRPSKRRSLAASASLAVSAPSLVAGASRSHTEDGLEPRLNRASSSAGESSTVVSADGAPRRSERIAGLMKTVMRAAWSARLTHRLQKGAEAMNSLDRKLAAMEPAAAAAGRRSSAWRPRPSEDLSFWGF